MGNFWDRVQDIIRKWQEEGVPPDFWGSYTRPDTNYFDDDGGYDDPDADHRPGWLKATDEGWKPL